MSKFQERMKKNRALGLGLDTQFSQPPVNVSDEFKYEDQALTDSAELKIDQVYHVNAEEFHKEAHIGSGQFGSVHKMTHQKLPFPIAVKKIHLNTQLDERERRRWATDLDVCKRSSECPYTVSFYGALVYEGDVWICMELLDRSLEMLVILVYGTLERKIPVRALKRISYSVVNALNYLKEKLSVLHRDVKPSNILISKEGVIKLCDFGIAGVLQGSFCSTNIGCARFMALASAQLGSWLRCYVAFHLQPERIDSSPGVIIKYDSRSDVWSFGLTMYELAVGKSPYPEFETPFQRIEYIVDKEAPQLAADVDLDEDCRDFINHCLTKDVEQRPRYPEILAHCFLAKAAEDDFDMGAWYKELLELEALEQ